MKATAAAPPLREERILTQTARVKPANLTANMIRISMIASGLATILQAIASDVEAMPVLSAYIFRRSADAFRVSSQARRSRVHLHFDH